MASKDHIDVSRATQIEAKLGSQVAQARLSRNITQKRLAGDAGISWRTLQRFEAGKGASLETFIRIMDALGLEGKIASLIPAPGLSPVERVRGAGGKRRRARSVAETEWTWGDDTHDDD